MDASLRRALTEALGEGGVLHDGWLLLPGSAEGVAAVLRIAHDHRLRLRISSGAGAGVTGSEGVAVLSLAGLTALRIDTPRGIVRAEAGATLTALRAALAGAGVAVPGLDAEPVAERVGELVARGELPRRSLTGIEAVLPGGDAIMAGAAVLKDVVGYDVTSLLLGSRGRLAAIVAAHLRLVPAGVTVEVADPAGVRAVEELAAVFDPQGLLAEG
ncbi:MAG: FAD-binding protein [Candidatus Dormibacteria bacterium]